MTLKALIIGPGGAFGGAVARELSARGAESLCWSERAARLPNFQARALLQETH